MAQPNYFSPQTQWGASLSNLVDSLYSPDAELKREERRAKSARDQADMDLKRAQIDDYKMKREAEARKARQEAEMISSVVGNMFGQGQQYGNEVLDFRNKGGFSAPPQLPSASGRPDVDDQGIAMAMEPIPAPRGYTPGADAELTKFLLPLLQAGGLTGKTNYEQLAGGRLKDQERDARDGIMASAPQDPLRVAQAFFATSGNAPFKDTDGRMSNLVTGALNESGAQATANVGKTQSERVENLAQAERARREGAPPIERVPDSTSPSGFRYVLRKDAVGMAAPAAPNAGSAKDATIPTTPNVTAGQRELQGIEQLKGTIAQFRQVAKDPRNFGVSGWLRQTAQDAIQQGNALAQTIGSRADAMVGEITSLGHEVGVDNFDKNLPLLDLYANVLAFQMASALQPGSKVSDRDFRTFRSMIGDAGALANQSKALTNIDGIESMLVNQERIVRNFLGAGQQPGVNYTPQMRAGSITPAPQMPIPPASGAGVTVSRW